MAKEGVCWDTRSPNSGRANPDIVITMDKYKWFPHQAKSLRLYDPFFNTGAIEKSYIEVGWTADQIDHRKENCFGWFERRITQKTMFLTNPPFSEDVLLSFFALLAHMDLPFVLILRKGIYYFGDFWELMCQEERSGNFFVRSYSRAFPMHNTKKTLEARKVYVKGFAGLTLVTYSTTQRNGIGILRTNCSTGPSRSLIFTCQQANRDKRFASGCHGDKRLNYLYDIYSSQSAVY